MASLMPGRCSFCGERSPFISSFLAVCKNCLVNDFSSVKYHLTDKLSSARHEFNLPKKAPHQLEGVSCTLCSNHCQIRDDQFGYCGLRTAKGGRLIHLAGTPSKGILHWYLDPLPTNCVADWVCEGSLHQGYHNLAVFYASCTANCLFCQNWHFRRTKPRSANTISAGELAARANTRTFCVCFFGGDPSSQMPHALAVSRMLAENGIRICWETNGMMNQKFLRRAVEYSLNSGGCIKFDLKAFDEGVHYALTGVSNQQTLENFSLAGERFRERQEPPLVIASTLLIPGYIDTDQVSKLADYIAGINPDIPYSLLAFAPNFFLSDLPFTSISQAKMAKAAAQEAGLHNVHIGNRHLLGLDNTWL
jgi:pyruvate formate lyase activating enzyme